MAGVRPLHVEQGIPNPLDNRLRLELVLREINARKTAKNAIDAP